MPIRIRIQTSPKTKRRRFFTLTAEARLRTDGPTQGYLDYIVFTARSARSLYMWQADRSGNFIVDFSALVPEKTATEVVRELHQGKTVELPGRYELEQLRGRFNFPDNAKQA
jgi:hypothetical protein